MYDNSPKETQGGNALRGTSGMASARVPSPRDIRLGEEEAKEKAYWASLEDAKNPHCAETQQAVQMPACSHLEITRMQLKDQRDRVHDEYWVCLGCGLRFAPQI